MTKDRHVSIPPLCIDAAQGVGEKGKGPNDREGRGRAQWKAEQGHATSGLQGRE